MFLTDWGKKGVWFSLQIDSFNIYIFCPVGQKFPTHVSTFWEFVTANWTSERERERGWDPVI